MSDDQLEYFELQVEAVFERNLEWFGAREKAGGQLRLGHRDVVSEHYSSQNSCRIDTSRKVSITWDQLVSRASASMIEVPNEFHVIGDQKIRESLLFLAVHWHSFVRVNLG